MLYEIVIDNILAERMASYFTPMKISIKGKQTFITGNLIDHASLYGLIATIRDLNLKLVSINRLQRR